jgi:KaiC/GvpD/RAD55 family RecA-like ATPase
VFIVEEARDRAKLPEEFVSDVVIRLGFRRQSEYLRRTLEIEKIRGRSHVRAPHDFLIRTGKGSTTGRHQNADDPKIEILDLRLEKLVVNQSPIFSCFHLCTV